jgi:hypothetical protein
MFYFETRIAVVKERDMVTGDRLSGQAVFFDGGRSVLLAGRLVLNSDGRSRSEIVVRNLSGHIEERIVFTGGNRWIPVYQLIQVIREAYDVSAAVPPDTSAPIACGTCGGLKGGLDIDGNWRDCPTCC